MEFSIEKCVKVEMKRGKQHLTNGMEQPNKEKIERSEKRKPTNTWGYWKLITSNKWRWKKKLWKSISGEPESFSGQNYIAETLSKE